MHLGTQDPQHSDDVFKQLAQLGVKHVCSDPAGSPHDWTIDDIKRHQDRLGSFGVSLDMVQLPLSSRPIEQSKSPDILSKGSNRDKQIDSICSLIERVAEAGIHATKYNLNIIGIPRSEDELGRGGSRNSTFRWDKMDQNAAPGMVGVSQLILEPNYFTQTGDQPLLAVDISGDAATLETIISGKGVIGDWRNGDVPLSTNTDY